MADIAKLKAEIDGDPLPRGYSDMTDAEAAASLNTEDRSEIRPMSMQQLREWAAVGGRGFKVKQAIDNEGLDESVRNLAYIGDKLMGTDDAQLNPGNAEHVAFVNGLVAGGVISSADKDAMVEKATVAISRAVELGIGRVREGTVAEARAQ